MGWFNWKNIAAIILGGIVAGGIIAVFNQYQSSKRNKIGLKLYEGQKALLNNNTLEVDKLIKETPKPSRSFLELLLGDKFFSQKKFDKSERYFEKGREDIEDKDRNLNFLILEKEAYIDYLQGKYKKSLDLLNRIDENAPNFCSFNLLKAEIYISLKDFEKAKDLISRLLNACTDSNTQLTVKWLLIKIKEQKEKIK